MSKGSLLLVDDDRLVLESMADWLREQGYALDTANSFAAAETALAKKVDWVTATASTCSLEFASERPTPACCS